MSYLLRLARKAWREDKQRHEHDEQIFTRPKPEYDEDAVEYLRVNRPEGDPRWCRLQPGLISILNCGRIQTKHKREGWTDCEGCRHHNDSRALGQFERFCQETLREFPLHTKGERG